jgi:hypothetical protein
MAWDPSKTKIDVPSMQEVCLAIARKLGVALSRVPLGRDQREVWK